MSRLRPAAAAASAVAVLLLGGCTAEPPAVTPTGPGMTAGTPTGTAPAVPSPPAAQDAAPGPESGTAAAPGGPSPTGGTAAVCASATQLSGSAAAAFAADLRALVDTAAAGDPAAVARAQQRVERGVTVWATGLRDLAGRTTEPAVRTALDDLAAEVGRLRGDLAQADTGRIAELRERLDRACGKG